MPEPELKGPPPGKSFADELLEDMRFTSHVAGLKSCNQCGSCAVVCPAARFSEKGYNPRTIVKRVLDGDRGVIGDEVIWECFYCYSCHMYCPKRVSPATLIQVLRDRAIQSRLADDKIADFLDYAECFWEFGIGSTPNEFFLETAREWGEKWRRMRSGMDRLRERLGLLPAIPPDAAIREIQHIMQATGFLSRLAIIREAHEKKLSRRGS